MMMRLLLLLTCLQAATAVAQTAASPPQEEMQRNMQRAILRDRDRSEVEKYLQAGFDLHWPIGCGTFDALDGAVSIGDPEMVTLLLRYGARPKESTFVRAAFRPAADKAVKIIAAFLQAGADVNSKDYTPGNRIGYWTALHWAVWQQNVELVRLLLSQKGVSLNDVDGDGQTALNIAKDKGDATIVALLLQAGADAPPSGTGKAAPQVASLLH
jgi:ankyrin repeat protein